jgi:hypothetical protein
MTGFIRVAFRKEGMTLSYFGGEKKTNRCIARKKQGKGLMFFCSNWQHWLVGTCMMACFFLKESTFSDFEESCFWTLSIVQCFSLKTTFLPSSGKNGGKGVVPTLWDPLERASLNH